MLRSRLLFVFCFVSALIQSASAGEPEDIAFVASCDGTEQRYVQILPPDFQAEQPHDVLIALHGHGSDRWQFAKDDRAECRSARDVAAKHGLIYLSPDYRARTSWMGPKAEADIVQIIGDIRKQHRVGKVFLCGGSMGGTSALAFAALHPELIAGVASMNGTANLLEFTGFPEAITESYGGTKALVPDVYKARSAEYWPERLTMPVGLTTGGQDTVVPPGSVQRLAAVLKLMDRNVLLLHRPDGGHSTTYDDGVAILEHILK